MIRELHNVIRRHLSDDELAVLATGDLPSRKPARVERHLAACDACRARCRRFEDLFSQVVAYHSYRTGSDKQDDLVRRSRLAARLNQMPDDVPDTEVVRPAQARHRVGALLPMNPILAAGLILAFASITCVFVWMQQSKPVITSNALLVRAEAWDPGAVRDSAPGVIRQTVKITSGKQSLKRTIYRDAKGKRKSRETRVADDENMLRSKLATADVVWDAPLSATSYQDWHDTQKVREDHIRRAPGDLLVLTTTTPEGAVAAQSLTVRDTDFHPVRRTVSFRDSATVEIAELDYSVLPWTPEVGGLFQPEEEKRVAGGTRPLPTLVVLPPPPLTEEQLNEAELSTRLTLNRLHADTGEQIEVARGPQGIEVSGITDTEQRKHELEAELHMLPHVTASISSIEKLKAKPPQAGELSSVKVIEMQTQATPLETYYLDHGRSIDPLSKLSQQLFNAAFAIDLESKTIDDLEHRFSQRNGMSLVAFSTLTDLIFTHKQNLLAALRTEEELLVETEIPTAPLKKGPPSNTGNLLLDVAEQNLALTKELALGNGNGRRSAESIVAEIAGSLSDLHRAIRETQVVPPISTSQDERK